MCLRQTVFIVSVLVLRELVVNSALELQNTKLVCEKSALNSVQLHSYWKPICFVTLDLRRLKF